MTHTLNRIPHIEPLAQMISTPLSIVPNVVAVIPAFNEERFIASVVLNTLPFVRSVIVVDDGSSDRTAILAEQAGAQVIRQPHNQGKAQAMNAGFKAAMALNPAAVVCLDGDAQHDSADVPRVVQPILEDGLDVVIGSRFLGIATTAPGWRQAGQHALTQVTNSASGVHLTDSQSGFRAFSPTALRQLHFDTPGLSMESEMQFLLAKSGLRIQEVAISVRYLDGNKRNPLVHGLQVLDAILSLVARRRPLLFFSLPGALMSMMGLLVGMNVWFVMQHTGTLLVGRALLTSMLTVGGLLLALTGLMLHSVQHMASQIAGQVSNDLRLRPEQE